MTDLTTLVDYYKDSEESTRDARVKAERDRDYVDHKQLTAQEISTLKQRKQPPIQINRIKPKVDFLRGIEREGRTDPKAFPRTPGHDEDAESATDSLRFIADNTSFDQTKSAGFDNLLVEGVEGAEVVWNVEEKEIEINHLHWDRVFYDPHSRKPDFTDAKYKGLVVWLDEDDAKATYKGKDAIIDSAFADHGIDRTYDDKPTFWVDAKRKRVKVCQIYYQERGNWKLAHYTKAGFLVDPIDSPWIDDKGKPECGIELQSAYVDRDGNRYGVVRSLIDIQDEINKRRSKALHLLSQRQTFSNERAVGRDGIRKLKSELAKPDGHIEMNAGAEFGKDFGTLDTNDLATGQFSLLQEAKQEIDAVGANAALTGKEDQNQSGRAILARQSGGQLELTPIFDGHRAWQLRIYRQAWNRVRQFWTSERWIRVTDDEKNLKWVGLNRTITAGEQLQNEMGSIPPEFEGDPRLNVPVGIDNPISELDIDIIMEDIPDVVTIQQEQFDQLAQMYQANPQTNENPEGVPWKMVVEASALRNKDKVLGKEEDEGEQDPEMLAMAQRLEQMQGLLQQQAQQLEQAQLEAKAKVDDQQVKAAEVEIKQRQVKLDERKQEFDETHEAAKLQQERNKVDKESALESKRLDSEIITSRNADQTNLEKTRIEAQADVEKARIESSKAVPDTQPAVPQVIIHEASQATTKRVSVTRTDKGLEGEITQE